jgi:hypothetical protein
MPGLLRNGAPAGPGRRCSSIGAQQSGSLRGRERFRRRPVRHEPRASMSSQLPQELFTVHISISSRRTAGGRALLRVSAVTALQSLRSVGGRALLPVTAVTALQSSCPVGGRALLPVTAVTALQPSCPVGGRALLPLTAVTALQPTHSSRSGSPAVSGTARPAPGPTADRCAFRRRISPMPKAGSLAFRRETPRPDAT